MKHALQLIIALAISSLFFASPVMAATNQGLSWGVHLHDKLYYTMAISGPEATIHLNEAFYVNVTLDPPSIPDSMTDWTQVPDVDVDGWWSNGTAMGAYGAVFILLLLFGTGFVVPIGNFTFLEDLIQTYALWNSSTEFIGDSAHWGLRLVDSSTERDQTLEVTYLKSDGGLSTYSVTATNNTSHTTAASLLVTRSSASLDIIGWIRENILLVGAAVVVVVVIGAVVCMKRR